MKLSNEISELLIELVDIEPIDDSTLFEGNIGLLCQNLLELYGKTSNQKSHDLIIKIIDQSGFSFFTPRSTENIKSVDSCEQYQQAFKEEEKFNLNDDDFMNLLPINGYFH